MSVTSLRRLLALVAMGPLVLLGLLAGPASPASAHPLGNLSVNQYAGFTLRPDRVDAAVVVDTAEIPTLQDRSTVDTDRDGTFSEAERAAYAQRACAQVAAGYEVRVGTNRLVWTVGTPGYADGPGSGGLPTSRLSCPLHADATLGAGVSTVAIANHYRVDRVGWREMTAAGDGVRLLDSPLPGSSVSDELRAYPADLLSSALDVRSAQLRVEPGAGGAMGAPAVRRPATDPLSRWSAAAERRFQQLAGSKVLTPLVGLLAVLAALLLGAGHAVLPGHGKTVLAAYLAGRRGRLRDAFAVGATVTLTHTGGVLVVGALLSTSAAFAGEQILGYLGLASGVLVIAVGAGMLVGALRGRRLDHGHSHHDHSHHDHDHSHSHHDHGHHDHDHDHGQTRRGGRLGLAGIGLAGGLVPSPSALVVLLGAVALGRAGFGVLLVLAYGLGMAGTLIGAGLLLLAVQRRLSRATAQSRFAARLSHLAARVPAAASTATAALVLCVGAGLALRAAVAVW